MQERAQTGPGPAAQGGSAGPGPAVATPPSAKALAAWCLYDWANSAFPTVIITFLFSAYFIGYVADDPERGTALWGRMLSLLGLAVALSSPPLGAIADQGGRRKPWLGALTALCVLATAALWFVRPDRGDVLLALLLAGFASYAFELGMVFYNAMLPDLVPEGRVGRLSGWGWGLGYAGGLACLAVALFGLVQTADPPFGLDRDAAEHVRAVAPLVALWFALFALPLFLVTPDRPHGATPPRLAVRAGLATFARTLRRLPRNRNVAFFLLAKMIYIDGLNTLFAFGGIYAVGTFGMTIEEVLLFGILLNVTAGLGAAAFAWIDDWIGAKPTVVIALLALTTLGSAILLVDSRPAFYALALGIGVFLGPTQAASRSLMARLAPPELRTEFFGLYAFAGKATAFLGPALVGWATLAFDSQRAGMAMILPFFLVGLLLLLFVRESRDGRRLNAGSGGSR